MLLWSHKIKKSVAFREEVADETLLAAVETELEKQPHKTFSDLCKEALWQFLYVPESVRPTTSLNSDRIEEQIAGLQSQLVSLSQRVAASESTRVEALESQLHQRESTRVEALESQLHQRESTRLDALERQLNQLALQVAQLAIAVNQLPRQAVAAAPVPVPASEPAPEPETFASSQEVDPLLRRLGSLLDDF